MANCSCNWPINWRNKYYPEQAKSTLQQAKAIELQAKSLSQQNEALKLQSISLEAQIKELQEARVESSKQTEEFFIQNMNVKLDRYYTLLEDTISKEKVFMAFKEEAFNVPKQVLNKNAVLKVQKTENTAAEYVASAEATGIVVN